MLLRLITGVGLLALGYYVGKQVGRTESIREELSRARESSAETEEMAPAGDDSTDAAD
jgi:hypothetical protein